MKNTNESRRKKNIPIEKGTKNINRHSQKSKHIWPMKSEKMLNL